MRKIMFMALACATLCAGARGTMEAGGNTMTVDTIFHAPVGPGTTQTQLRLYGTGGADISWELLLHAHGCLGQINDEGYVHD